MTALALLSATLTNGAVAWVPLLERVIRNVRALSGKSQLMTFKSIFMPLVIAQL